MTRQQNLSANGVVLQAYELRGAGAVMHSHSLNAVMATLVDPVASEFTVTNLEMVKVRSLLFTKALPACSQPFTEHGAQSLQQY